MTNDSIDRGIKKCHEMKTLWAGNHSFNQIEIILEAMKSDDEPDTIQIDKLEKIDIILGIKKCPLCGKNHDADELNEKINNMTVYGMDLKTIADVLDFAIKKGWRQNNV